MPSRSRGSFFWESFTIHGRQDAFGCLPIWQSFCVKGTWAGKLGLISADPACVNDRILLGWLEMVISLMLTQEGTSLLIYWKRKQNQINAFSHRHAIDNQRKESSTCLQFGRRAGGAQTPQNEPPVTGWCLLSWGQARSRILQKYTLSSALIKWAILFTAQFSALRISRAVSGHLGYWWLGMYKYVTRTAGNLCLQQLRSFLTFTDVSFSRLILQIES